MLTEMLRVQHAAVFQGSFGEHEGIFKDVTDFVILYMPFASPWSWILLLWALSTGFLRWWSVRVHQDQGQTLNMSGQKRETRQFLKLMAQMLFALSALFFGGLFLLLVMRLMGPGLLAVFALIWWGYLALGFARPRARLQKVVDYSTAGILVGVAVLFELYIGATGPVYYLSRINPSGSLSSRYVSGLAIRGELSSEQLMLFLNSDTERLRENALVYLSKGAEKPVPEIRERVLYMAQYDRSEAVKRRVRSLPSTFVEP